MRENKKGYEAVHIHNPREVYEFMKNLRHSDRERFYSLSLDAKNKVVNCEEVSCGSASSTSAHPREVFKSAILSSSISVILVHNHPSGDPTPSIEDEALIRRLYEAGELLGIDVLDSVIIGEDSYYSFKEAGKIGNYRGAKNHL